MDGHAVGADDRGCEVRACPGRGTLDDRGVHGPGVGAVEPVGLIAEAQLARDPAVGIDVERRAVAGLDVQCAAGFDLDPASVHEHRRGSAVYGDDTGHRVWAVVVLEDDRAVGLDVHAVPVREADAVVGLPGRSRVREGAVCPDEQRAAVRTVRLLRPVRRHVRAGSIRRHDVVAAVRVVMDGRAVGVRLVPGAVAVVVTDSAVRPCLHVRAVRRNDRQLPSGNVCCWEPSGRRCTFTPSGVVQSPDAAITAVIRLMSRDSCASETARTSVAARPAANAATALTWRDGCCNSGAATSLRLAVASRPSRSASVGPAIRRRCEKVGSVATRWNSTSSADCLIGTALASGIGAQSCHDQHDRDKKRSALRSGSVGASAIGR